MTTTNQTYTLTDEQYKEFTDAFRSMDHNGSGMLSSYDLGVLMRSLAHNPTDEELNEIIIDYDVIAKGGVTLEDFLTMMLRREQNSALGEKLTAAFAVFDRDGNGFVAK